MINCCCFSNIYIIIHILDIRIKRLKKGRNRRYGTVQFTVSIFSYMQINTLIIMQKSSIKANKIAYPSSFIQYIRTIKYKYTHDLYTKSAMDMQPTAQQQNDEDGVLNYEQLELEVPEPVVVEPEPQQKKIPPDGRFTLALVFAILAVCIGSSFQFGYHIGNMNIPGAEIKKWLNQSHEQMFGHETSPEFIDTISEIAVGIFAVGGMLGGISVGFIADKFGRKTTLICNNVLAVLAAALMVNAKTIGYYFVFIAGRFVIGLNSGLNSGLAPMYLMEISPANLRGTVGSCAQLFITIAILFGQILGLPALLGTAENWPLIFGFAIVPVIVQLCTLPLCPESPKFNFMRGRKDQAEEDLKKLRREDVSAELEQLNEEAVLASSQADVTMKQMFGAELRWPLGLAVFMMVSQQLSGINAAMFYSSKIFERAQLPEFWSNMATLAMGLINVLMTVVSVYLVDRLGRRILLLSGMVGMLFSTMMITSSMLIAQAWDWYSYMSILFVLLFVISFATGPGSIPWFYVSELFPSNARGNANTIAVFTNWLFTFFLGFYPKLDSVLPAYSFLFFTGCLLLSILFALKFLPETKNKTLEEIHEEMNRRRGIINEETDV